MCSPSLNTIIFCIQQTCVSPHSWHRVVKSCLHGTLRSKKTDKLVSKRTTKSWIKNLLCRYFCWLGNRKKFTQAGFTIAAGWKIVLAGMLSNVLVVHIPFTSLPSIHLTTCFGFISPLLTFCWRHSKTNDRQQVQKSATRQHQVQAI